MEASKQEVTTVASHPGVAGNRGGGPGGRGPGFGGGSARPLLEGPVGNAHDLATLVKGAALRRQGKSAEAITVLQPIVGKLLDPFARPILYEELVEALLDEQRYDEALVFAEAWLRAGAA